MASHVWNRRPTKERAIILLTAFKYALKQGWHPVIARCFAGYWAERQAQGLRQFGWDNGRFTAYDPFVEFVRMAAAGGHRYAAGKNGRHYSETFKNHLGLMLDPWYRIAGLVPETPPLILADWLEQHGDDEKAELVRSMVAV